MAEYSRKPIARKNQGTIAPDQESFLSGNKHVLGSAAENDVALTAISLVKGPERWHFRWSSGDESALINRIAELARDPSIPFDWYDAAVVCKHIAQPFRNKSQNSS